MFSKCKLFNENNKFREKLKNKNWIYKKEEITQIFKMHCLLRKYLKRYEKLKSIFKLH